MDTMRAARLHHAAQSFHVDNVARPQPTGADVQVQVQACGVVPNLRNVIHHFPQWFPHLPLPDLPAIFGLDPAGVVTAVGPDAQGFQVGQRVYVNPVRTCGVCVHCRHGQLTRCPAYTFAGYFGFSPQSKAVQARYPWGGFAEYMIAPVNSLVTLPDNLSAEAASRFGYLGTSYAALLRGGASVRSSLLINGATGTLGVGVVLLALALGVPKIYAVARNRDLLERLRTLAPHRIETFSTLDGSAGEWVRARTGAIGVDLIIEAMGPEAPLSATLDAFGGLSNGGTIVTVGGQKEQVPLDPIWMMACDITYKGSNWFTTAMAQDMADMVGSGVLDLAPLTYRRFSLDEVDVAIEAARHRDGGGFTSIAVCP